MMMTTNTKIDTLILQLGVILNTVPAWKKAYKLRVAVFVEYESDVEEERGRVMLLLENLRIEAEVLVFWLASGDLSTYEVIVNGSSHNEEAEKEVEECLKGQEWWEEIQKIRGNRGPSSGTEDLVEIASIFTAGSNWPESSFQQGPRGEKVERFLGLRKLLKRSKRRHTMSGITKLGVSLGMRTQRLSQDLVNQHQASASEDSSSDVEVESDTSSTGHSDEENGGQESAASEGDLDDFASDSESSRSIAKIKRRRSHGDSMRGPPPSKKSTGEREIVVPQRTPRQTSDVPNYASTKDDSQPPMDTASLKGYQNPTRKPASVSNLSSSLKASPSNSGSGSKASSLKDKDKDTDTNNKLLSLNKKSSTGNSSTLSERPAASRHVSQHKFSSRPVPITRIATEDGPGPSIMFSDSPPPPPRRSRLPSAYQSTDRIPELTEESHSPTPSRHGSMYSTQSLPISFNDLPCRAQHLILNELMRSVSDETAVMFTTLPSPIEGTSKSVEASVGYLGDLEVLCRACPPVLMVHSNSMTVTMSL
jgi:potassium/chloride transporter 9